MVRSVKLTGEKLSRTLLITLQIASHLAYMVIIPLAILGGLGLWLDRQFDTLPIFLLIGIALAFTSTMLWMSKRLRPIIEQTTKGK